MTETNANLAAALAAFQAEMPVVHKGNRADVPTKSGGKYSYTYADLGDVTKAAMPLLTQHGLSFMAKPRATERGYEIVGVLLHTSGEREEGSLPINGNTPQELGSSITYMRRYLMGCMTGIVTDDDDDGRTASQPQKRAAKKAAAKPPAVEPSPPEYDSGGHVIDVDAGPMKPNTRGRLFALFGDLNIPDDQQLSGMNHLLGTTYTSRSEVREGEARRVIKQLEDKKRSQVAVNA